MKRYLTLLIFFAVLTMGLATDGFCREIYKKEKTNRRIIRVGTELYYYKYEEPNMQQDGLICGLNMDWSYYISKFLMRAEGLLGGGQIDYTSTVSGNMDGADNFIFEIRGLGGYDFDITNTTVLTPFIGAGYRYLNDDSSGKITNRGALGYERESNYLYSPIGLETDTNMGNGWFFGITAEYDIFWQGKQKSNLSAVFAGLNDVSNDQKEGYGIRGSIRLRKEMEKYSVVFEPFIRYWDIEKSEVSNVIYQGVVIAYGWEPENETMECGAKLKIGF